MNSQPLWKMFEGRSNTEDLLREKAAVVGTLITMSFDAAEGLASEMKFTFGVKEAVSAKAETSALWLHIVDRHYAFKLLSPNERDVFMSALEADIIEKLRSLGIDRPKFLDLLQARYAEYSGYKFAPENEQGNSKGTLLWEFDKKVAAILGVGKSAIFNEMLSVLLLRQLARWDLHTLISG